MKSLEILTDDAVDLPPLNAMRAFEAVARLGGVAVAATELGVTSGAVSQQIRLLETVLGAKLMARAGRGVTLTSEGRAVAELIEEPFRGLREARLRLGRCDGPEIVRLGAPGAFGSRWLAARLDRFEAYGDGFPVRLVCDPGPHALDRFQIDLEVRFNTDAAPPVHAVRLMRDSFSAVVSPSLIGSDPGADWRRVLSHARLIQCEEASVRGLDWRRWLEARDIEREDVLSGDRVGLFEHAIEAAAAGRGVALAPCSLVEAAAGRVCVLAEAGVEPMAGGYDLFWPEGRGLGAPGHALKAFLIKESRAIDGGDCLPSAARSAVKGPR